ncbi:MAG: type II toxin-antitoxin system Phd/YefM family antitoxin [Oscillospiraceae bacterium]|jgi:PHD/YefM family antitoxin component YafN of YafNO toxin-antitoxin module|nr:type II toxin-antitoxin system Phd/YefM family antitoxin [Oscillospiraceae bacterium]
MPQIRPITDLRNTTEISNLCHAGREPIFITKNGYGDMVVMSMEVYDELLSIVTTDAAITEAEEELTSGKKPENARTALAALRRKYFG